MPLINRLFKARLNRNNWVIAPKTVKIVIIIKLGSHCEELKAHQYRKENDDKSDQRTKDHEHNAPFS